MTARTEKLMQHGSVEGMIEAARKHHGADRMDVSAFWGEAGLDDPEALDDAEEDDQ